MFSMEDRHLLARFPALALLAGLLACSTPERANPLPEELTERAEIPGIPGARSWGDSVPPNYEAWFRRSEEELLAEHSAVYGRDHHYLSISGGGPNGAFGAGLLCGWTEEGSRPEFSMVTGISTGALIAPFAFLGSEYDGSLEEIYTTFATKDLVKEKGLLDIAFGDSAVDSAPMLEKVRQYYDQELLDEIARETRRGRVLLIGTTQLDAQRPVIWNIGHIAESGAPNRLEIFQKVIMASAAIPGLFPPVYFDVEVDGERFDELHVDGGVTSQLFLYPMGVDWDRVLELLEVSSRPRLYSIRNAKLSPEFFPVDGGILSITAGTISAQFHSVALGDMYRIYVAASRDGLDYRLAMIPEDFDAKLEEPFDNAYMRELFAVGRQMGVNGYEWHEGAPGVLETDGD